jgi:hypothetical protein
MKKPQPGQWVQVTEDYISTDLTAVLVGRTLPVIEPGEFEEEGEITVFFADEEYYLQIAHVCVVPSPDNEPA